MCPTVYILNNDGKAKAFMSREAAIAFFKNIRLGFLKGPFLSWLKTSFVWSCFGRLFLSV
jgi:hypothetical protein